MEESLELRIDVSLDQDKDSYVDVVNLESDCPIASSSNSSDGGNISGPEHVELVSPTTPPKVFRSASKRFSSLSFAERCYHIMNYLRSPESDSLSILHNPQMGQAKLQEKDRILQMG